MFHIYAQSIVSTTFDISSNLRELLFHCNRIQVLGFHISHKTFKRMSEPPFVPRERLLKKQQYFQSIHKHTYLKGPYDKITSVAIPIALAVTSGYMIVRGIYNMSHGTGKKE